MSNTSSNHIKTVRYYGKVFEVPSNAKYIHTDNWGQVYTTQDPYEVRPFAISWTYPIERFPSAYPVGSFNHTQMSAINWMLSQKRISDLPSVCTGLEQVPHPHADLMLKYAQIAQYSDKPGEEFQFKSIEGVWLDCGTEVPFYPLVEYRLKPQPICIKEGQLWRSTKESVLVEVHSVKHPELQKGSIVVAQRLRLNPELTLYSELTKTELQEHFTLVK